jgi:predicted TIM-barrel fold metal-dependent hydrolase
MIVDFQQHYTPAELLKGDPRTATVQLDQRGNPNYFLNPLLADLPAHVRMMDRAGIDAGVLSCGVGFDQPDLKICRTINERMAQAERDFPGRFIGLAHVPALKPDEAKAELKRCAVDLGFPGVVIASEMQNQALDAEALRPFWRACAELGLYVFIHPLAKVINWDLMNADDLGRMFGWEFSLIVATIRIINSGLLDELPDLKVHFSHFSGGIGRYRGRYNGFQQRAKWGTSQIKGHNRQPKLPVDYYLNHKLYYDCAGWAGPDPCGPLGADWVKFGLQELALSQCVFATDYPQAIRDPGEVDAYVKACEALDPNANALVHGLNADKLIPNIKDRLAKRKK